MNEMDEYAVEEALKHQGGARRRGDRALHGPGRARPRRSARRCRWARTRPSTSSTTALHGSDAVATSLVLAKALGHDGRSTWCMLGSESTRRPDERGAGDARRAARPAAADLRQARSRSTARQRDDQAADRRRLPGRRGLDCPRWSASSRRSTSRATRRSRGSWPRRRSRSRRSSLADLGVDAGEVGLGGAWSEVEDFEPAPAAPGRHRSSRTRATGGASSPSSSPSKKFV